MGSESLKFNPKAIPANVSLKKNKKPTTLVFPISFICERVPV